MPNLTISISNELKTELDKFPELNLSEVVRRLLIKKLMELKLAEEFSKKVNPSDEELNKWALALGEKAKEESFKKLASKLSAKEKKELGL